MKGLPVGVVKERIDDPTSYYPLIRVAPVADFSKLEEKTKYGERDHFPDSFCMKGLRKRKRNSDK